VRGWLAMDKKCPAGALARQGFVAVARGFIPARVGAWFMPAQYPSPHRDLRLSIPALARGGASPLRVRPGSSPRPGLKPRATDAKPPEGGWGVRLACHGHKMPRRGISPPGLRGSSAGVYPRAGGGVVYARAIPITTSGFALVHPCVCPGWGIAFTCSPGVITPPGAEAQGYIDKAP